MRQEAWTITANGIANRLILPVRVTGPNGVAKEFPGLIDTGATHTCVSGELVEEMGLVSVGQTKSGTASGAHDICLVLERVSWACFCTETPFIGSFCVMIEI